MNPASPVPSRVLVVDDEPDLRTLYEMALLREGYEVCAARDLAEARSALEDQGFDLLLTDMRLPDGLGLALLQEVAISQGAMKCIVITAYGSAENAVQALKAGAFDYLTKPVDLQRLRQVVKSALEGGGAHDAAIRPVAKDRKAGTHAQSGPDSPGLIRLVGASEPMSRVRSRIRKVAVTMAPVLIQGESGTGKELVARAIHDCSHRASGPFVAVNCGAIPETLLETEFFGARKGAYTGSVQDRSGYFQVASGGTLFLDEIGDLPLAMQSKLLRAIQERMVRAVGSTAETPVDVRIVSASHKDLGDEVAQGRFRQDLFYRLNVIGIPVPPLRERKEDLPDLCQVILERIASDAGCAVPDLSDEAIRWLYDYDFPGNVRELENVLHRAFALSEGDALQLHQTDDRVAVRKPQSGAALDVSEALMPQDLEAHLDEQERRILVRALEECGYNRTAAAQRLGITLRKMRYRMDRLNIPVPSDLADLPDESQGAASA
ncbi:MAG: hypothetical protein RLZZ271_820 [Pseudomonadota bacterium]|jgi:two-component system response regulator PilR (NtrC family)